MTVWALGDYPRLAREVLAGLGPRLVRACGVRPGLRVLDVGTGSGLVALAAAEAGADVVGVDVSPELLGAARASGAAVEWAFAGHRRVRGGGEPGGTGPQLPRLRRGRAARRPGLRLPAGRRPPVIMRWNATETVKSGEAD
jgi:SAM-dependent methyltransferase